jgi:16S rRNA processing protein RimM
MLLQPYLNDLVCYQHLGDVTVSLADGQFQHAMVTQMRQVGARMLLKLAGCVSRETAQSLTGSEICVQRDTLPPPPDGEFYWWDLEGLTVYAENGQCLGRVEEFFPTGSNEVLVVRKDQQETLLPFTKEVILSVDATQGIMQVHAMPGLL